MSGFSLYQRIIQPLEEQMIRSIWRIVRNADDADDVLQDALAVIWKRLDRIQSHPNPTALILRICIDAAYDFLRRKHRHECHFVCDGIEEELTGSDPTASERLIDCEMEYAIHHAIAELPQNQSTALLMRIVQNCSYTEIAEALGCSESTARVHLSRGRAALSQQFADLNPEQRKA